MDVWAFGLLGHYLLFKKHYFLAPTEPLVKSKVLKEPYALKSAESSVISKDMANFLTSCLQMDKHKRLPATKIASHPVFDKVRSKIEVITEEIVANNIKFEAQLMKNSAKGALINKIMSYNFLFDLAGYFAKRERYNPTALLMIKYNVGELHAMRDELQKGTNIIGHPQWK